MDAPERREVHVHRNEAKMDRSLASWSLVNDASFFQCIAGMYKEQRQNNKVYIFLSLPVSLLGSVYRNQFFNTLCL